MLRKTFLIVALLFAFPALANAWYVNAKTSPATGLGTISPSGNQSYLAGANSGEFTVTPANGYTVSRVTLDGATLSSNANGKYVAPYLAGRSWRYLVGYFVSATVSITTGISGGSGAIREDTNESLTKIPAGSARQLLIIPNPGYSIATVTAAGAASISDNSDGTKTVIYTNLQANQSVTASFALIPVVTASAGSDVASYGAGAEFAATLHGSAVSNQGAISYAWSGTGLSFGTPTANITTVYAASPGSYPATLTVTSGGIVTLDSATVTVFDRTDYLEGLCTSCHSGNTPQVVSAYDASAHKANHTSCQDCHSTTPHGALPTGSVCAACHADTAGNVLNHPVQIGTMACNVCHEPHTTAASRTASLPPPHFNTITTGRYPASYVTPRSSCGDCHSTADNNAAIRSDWAASGHGDTGAPPWTGNDFKTEAGCARCHTTTGYVNYVTSGFVNMAAWGDPADPTKEVLACNGCHNPDFSRRAFSLVDPSGPSFSFTFPVSGTDVATSYKFSSLISPNGIKNSDSNNCMLCHRGNIDGEIIKKAAAFGDFTGVGRLLPHGMAAAGMLGDLSGAGYNYNEDYNIFSGKSDQSRHWSYHEYIGSANYHDTGNRGACVTCHMSDTRHNFAAVFKNSTGSITAVATQAICNNCHPSVNVAGPMDVTILKARKAEFASALQVLKALLQKSGFDPDSSASKNWGGTQTIRSNNMGAYYNYFLFRDGDRASYVHGPAYTRRLILSSITWLDDNSFNVSAYATINTLAGEGRISAATRDSAISFLGITATPGTLTGICANCHPGHSNNFNPY